MRIYHGCLSVGFSWFQQGVTSEGEFTSLTTSNWSNHLHLHLLRNAMMSKLKNQCHVTLIASFTFHSVILKRMIGTDTFHS